MPVQDPKATVVLVVDDDPGVLRVVSKVLRRGGFQVLEALGGVEGVRLAEEERDSIDILLTDVVMPDIGGREVGERVSALIPGIPVVFMSAYTEDEVMRRGIGSAKTNFIGKPFTVEELRTKIHEVLEGAGSAL